MHHLFKRSLQNCNDWQLQRCQNHNFRVRFCLYSRFQVTFWLFPVSKKIRSNVELVTICGQLRTRDCRSLRLYLHCPTQPVIETTQRATTYPLPIDFDSVEEIVSDFGRSKFLNNWADVSALFSRSKITDSITDSWLRPSRPCRRAKLDARNGRRNRAQRRFWRV